MTQPPEIFDTPLLARRLAHSQGNFIIDMVASDLDDRLGFITRDIEKAALIAPSGAGLPDGSATALGPFEFDTFSTLAASHETERLIDPTRFDLPSKAYQLIASLLDLQVINDVPAYLERIRRHLGPDGLFIAAAIGGRTLTELREAWLEADTEMSGGVVPRVAPMIDVRDAGMLLQRAGFALPVTDIETHTVRYASPFALMEDLRAMGASNPLVARHGRLTSRGRLMRAAEIYAEKFSDPDGKVRATLEILWLSGWAPHESQQKPLKPGSAKVSLKDVLGKKG